MKLIGRNHDLIGQFLKGLKVGRIGKKQRKKKGKKYLVNRFAVEQEYNKSIKEKGSGELTSRTTKLMAISSRGEERIEDSEDCWRRSLLEFLKFSSNTTARKVGMRL